MTFTQPAPQIPRDRWNRPLVVPPGGGKPIAYTRCTTYVDCVEDKSALDKWKQRMVATGLASRPDLLLAVNAHSDDKKMLGKVCEDAMEAAKAHAAATTGTALHALTERIDRGQDVGVVPDAYLADLAAYTEATKDLESLHIEQFCVQDPLKIGGTPDRVVKYKSKKYIADVKTGSVDFGALKIAMQLAVYARSHTYNIETGERGEHGAEMDWGIIIHLPAGTGTCELIWVDLLAGWEGVKVARQVRDLRTKKFKDVTKPFNPVDAPTVLEPVAEPTPLDLPGLVAQCPTEDALRNLWAIHASEWDDSLTALASARVAELKASA